MIITICGSYKFTEKMWDVYQQLTDSGYMVFLPAIGCTGKYKDWYMDLHFQKIEKSDAIYVIDVDRYTGESTKKEIEKAVDLSKTVYRYSNHDLGVK